MMRSLAKLLMVFFISTNITAQSFIFHEPTIIHDSLRIAVTNDASQNIYPVPKRNCTIKSNVLGKDSLNCLISTPVFQPFLVPCNIQNLYTFDCSDSLNRPVFGSFIRKGNFEGNYIVHHSNGSVLMWMILNKGIIEGPVCFYYSTDKEFIAKTFDKGPLMAEIEYKNNRLWSVNKLLDKNGKPLKKGSFKNGSGTLVFYRDNGTMLRTVELTNGELNGVCTYYYSNGSVLITGNYLNGEQQGSWKEYNIAGMVVNETIY